MRHRTGASGDVWPQKAQYVRRWVKKLVHSYSRDLALIVLQQATQPLLAPKLLLLSAILSSWQGKEQQIVLALMKLSAIRSGLKKQLACAHGSGLSRRA